MAFNIKLSDVEQNLFSSVFLGCNTRSRGKIQDVPEVMPKW
jgi:hypothetical protein